MWLRSVGSIKLQVSFAEYRLFYRALLQKRPIILSILLTYFFKRLHPCILRKEEACMYTYKYTHIYIYIYKIMTYMHIYIYIYKPIHSYV